MSGIPGTTVYTKNATTGQTQPNWPTNYRPLPAEWNEIFSSKADWPVPAPAPPPTPPTRPNGLVGDGVADDTVALQAFVNAGGGLLPPGHYRLTGLIALPSNCAIIGAGTGNTILFPATPGMTVLSQALGYNTPSNIILKNFGINAPAFTTPGGVTGISFVQSFFVWIEDVAFWGLACNVHLDRGSFFTLRSLQTGATANQIAGNFVATSTQDNDYIYNVLMDGLLIGASGDFSAMVGITSPAVQLRRAVGTFVTNLRCDHGGVANNTLTLVNIENDCQGVKVSKLICNAVNVGIQLSPGTGVAAAPTAVSIEDCDIDGFYAQGIAAFGTSAAPINLLSIRGGKITDAVNSNTLGIYLQYCAYAVVADVMTSQYAGQTSTCIGVENCYAGKITDCLIEGFSMGLGWGTGNSLMVIKDNTFYNVASVLTGSPVGNGGGNVFKNNIGLNPPAFGSFPTPALVNSQSYTNNTGYPMRVYISGGTIYGATHNGYALPASADIMILAEVGDSFSVAFGGGTTWVWVPL